MKSNYTLNHFKFNIIDSEPKAYWLGFLFADCGIKDNGLQLHLGKKDKDHVEKFKSFIETNKEIHEYKKFHNNQFYYTYSLSIFSKQLVGDLKRLGCIYPKMKREFPKELNKEFWSHFLRGLFDGDGCIFKEKQKKYRFGIFFIGTKAIIDIIQPILEQICNGKGGIQKCDGTNPDHQMYNLRFGRRNEIQLIGEYLYNNATIYLERKKKIYNELLQSIKDHSIEEVFNPYKKDELDQFILDIKEKVAKNEPINWSELATKYNRTEMALKKKAQRFKIGYFFKRQPISHQLDDELKQLTEIDIDQIAKKYQNHHDVIKKHVKKLGLIQKVKQKSSYQYWNEDEMKKLEQLINTKKNNIEIAIELNRTIQSVEKKREKINI